MNISLRFKLAWQVLLAIICCPIFLFAQKETPLKELTVKGIRPEKFMVGQKVQEVDSMILAKNRFSTLSDFLQFQAPVSFKNYGAGQLASVSFRGTSAMHTALLWNGLNINFPSLGQTDFSTIPLSGFDEMTILYGSAASTVGTDAIGGSIQLRSTPNLNGKGIKTQVAFQSETARNFTGNLGFRYNRTLTKGLAFFGKTLLYGSQNQNDFGTKPIQNKKGFTLPVEPIENQQKGFVQDLYLSQKNGNLLSLNIWITDNDLAIQPKSIILREITRTKAFRSVLAYQWGKTLLRTAFIRDITDFGKGENLNPSHSKVDRYIFRAEHDLSCFKNSTRKTDLKLGAEVVHFNADIDGYGTGIKTENRADIYALLRHRFSKNLNSSLNLRQAFVDGYNPPFTPSLGLEYTFFSSAKDKLNLPISISKSYRVPTLNERYWENLGNPDIRPEKSFNKELGLAWNHQYNSKTDSRLTATVFHNLIDDWTYWNPALNYRAENLQQVLSKGLEIESLLKSKVQKTDISFLAQYAYTDASQRKEFGAYTKDIIGKQLVYIPKHTASSTISLSRNALSLDIQQQYNSKRYITFDHSGQPFKPYYLMNIRMAYQKKLNNWMWETAIKVNNGSNTLYPSQKKNAMPMRSIALSIVLANF